MPHINDLKREWLAKAPQSVARAHVTEMFGTFLRKNASTSSIDINTAYAGQFLPANSQPGLWNDGQFAYLGSLGRTGATNDRLFAQYST